MCLNIIALLYAANLEIIFGKNNLPPLDFTEKLGDYFFYTMWRLLRFVVKVFVVKVFVVKVFVVIVVVFVVVIIVVFVVFFVEVV